MLYRFIAYELYLGYIKLQTKKMSRVVNSYTATRA
jgi:hypothetical protein